MIWKIINENFYVNLEQCLDLNTLNNPIKQLLFFFLFVVVVAIFYLLFAAATSLLLLINPSFYLFVVSFET